MGEGPAGPSARTAARSHVACGPSPAVSHGSSPSAASSTDRARVGHFGKGSVRAGRGNRADSVAGGALCVPAGTAGRA